MATLLLYATGIHSVQRLHSLGTYTYSVYTPSSLTLTAFTHPRHLHTASYATGIESLQRLHTLATYT